MDALCVLRRWTQKKWAVCGFVLACLFPLVAGSVARLRLGNWIFMDVDAVLCAADRLRLGQSPYEVVKHAVCNGGDPAAFVYAPHIASIFVPVVELFGVSGARHLYLALFLLPALMLLFWYALIKPFPRLAFHYRWLGAAGLSTITLWCANMGLVLHAMVLASLLLVPPGAAWNRIPFVVTVCLCACVKPTFLSYFIVFLVEDRPWRERLTGFAVSCAGGVAVVAAIFLTAGEHGADWMAALRAVALTEQPGLGWSAWTAATGLSTDSALNRLLLLGFMAAIGICGLAIAQWGGLEGEERTLLGLGLAPLLTPRLCDYDMILMVPFAALVMSVAHRQGRWLFRYTFSWMFAGVLLLGIATNVLEIKPYFRSHYAVLLTAVLTLVVGRMLLVRHRDEVRLTAQRWLRQLSWVAGPGPAVLRRLRRPAAEIDGM